MTNPFAQLNGPGPSGSEPDGSLDQAQVSLNPQQADDLLDEIDGLLETNAEEFVRAYVQKGGQ